MLSEMNFFRKQPTSTQSLHGDIVSQKGQSKSNVEELRKKNSEQRKKKLHSRRNMFPKIDNRRFRTSARSLLVKGKE